VHSEVCTGDGVCTGDEVCTVRCAQVMWCAQVMRGSQVMGCTQATAPSVPDHGPLVAGLPPAMSDDSVWNQGTVLAVSCEFNGVSPELRRFKVRAA
jgi:hypothetical protein